MSLFEHAEITLCKNRNLPTTRHKAIMKHDCELCYTPIMPGEYYYRDTIWDADKKEFWHPKRHVRDCICGF